MITSTDVRLALERTGVHASAAESGVMDEATLALKANHMREAPEVSSGKAEAASHHPGMPNETFYKRDQHCARADAQKSSRRVASISPGGRIRGDKSEGRCHPTGSLREQVAPGMLAVCVGPSW